MSASNPVALITGAGRRVGAATARQLHARGWTVLLHCRRSRDDADRLAAELNALRFDSARVLVADLEADEAIASLAGVAVAAHGRLDALINNASTFHPTLVGEITASDWDRLFASNARAPLFLTQALAPALRASGNAAVVNITDIHADYPLAGHVVYCMAKAALTAMTKSLAKELAPTIRVNGVAPGAILWPEGEGEMDAALQQEILRSIPLGREGGVDAIAEVVTFLITGGRYITGQIIAVDGGRSIWG